MTSESIFSFMYVLYDVIYSERIVNAFANILRGEYAMTCHEKKISDFTWRGAVHNRETK